MTTTRIRDDQLENGTGPAGEVDAVAAASVLVLRPPMEVLMMRRPERSSFVPGVWVFPGGAADDLDYELAREVSDDDIVNAMRVTAVRELFEEAGLWLGAPLDDAEQKRRRLLAGSTTFRHLLAEAPVDIQQLVWTSHWITPLGVPKRFDTYFFLARSQEGAVATAENTEAVDLTWISPSAALQRHEAGDFPLVFPTIRNLEALQGFESIEALMASRAGVEIPAIMPRIVDDGGRKKIVLP